MRSLLLVVALALPVDAAASSCYFGPYVQTEVPSIHCDVVVYAYAGFTPEGPRLQVHRDNNWVDVTGEVAREQTSLTVEYYERDCETQEHVSTRYGEQPFDVYRIKLAGALVGEELYVDGVPHRTITEGGCAATYEPDVTCAVTSYPCDFENEEVEDEDLLDGGGCHTSGNSYGGAALLVMIALAARRRRRDVRAGR